MQPTFVAFSGAAINNVFEFQFYQYLVFLFSASLQNMLNVYDMIEVHLQRSFWWSFLTTKCLGVCRMKF